jgi:hypothetical protein
MFKIIRGSKLGHLPVAHRIECPQASSQLWALASRLAPYTARAWTWVDFLTTAVFLPPSMRQSVALHTASRRPGCCTVGARPKSTFVPCFYAPTSASEGICFRSCGCNYNAWGAFASRDFIVIASIDRRFSLPLVILTHPSRSGRRFRFASLIRLQCLAILYPEVELPGRTCSLLSILTLRARSSPMSCSSHHGGAG